MQITLKPEGPVTAEAHADAYPQSFAYRLFAQDKLAQFAAIGMPQPQAENLVQMQWRGRNLTYATQYPGAEDCVIFLEDGTPVGHYLLQKTPRNSHLVDLAVLPEWRGQGIGTQALRQIVQQTAGAALSLRVEKKNPARNLYTRLGFVVVGEDELSYEMFLRQP